MLTQAQQDLRKQGIGGSEIAAVLGFDKYRSPLDVWAEKTGRVVSTYDPTNLTLRLGHLLEPIMANLYVERQDQPDTVRAEPGTTVVHPAEPIFLCTPDYYVSRLEQTDPETDPWVTEQWLLQCKTKTSRTLDGFGEPGTDEVPDAIAMQVQWEMGVTGLSQCDVGVLVLDQREFLVYSVAYDDALFGMLADRARDWWTRYVVADVEPPVGHHAQDVDYLKRKFAAHIDALLPPSDEAVLAVERLAATRAAAKDAEFAHESAKAAVMQLVGQFKGLHAPAGKVSWTTQKGRAITDWEAIARQLANGADLDPYIQQHTRIGAPTRVFRFTPAKES